MGYKSTKTTSEIPDYNSLRRGKAKISNRVKWIAMLLFPFPGRLNTINERAMISKPWCGLNNRPFKFRCVPFQISGKSDTPKQTNNSILMC